MPYYGKDNGDGTVTVKHSDDPPSGAIFKSDRGWAYIAWMPKEHIEIVAGKCQSKSQEDKDLADSIEPRFAFLKLNAKEEIDFKTTEIISEFPEFSVQENEISDGLKIDIDNSGTISDVNAIRQTNIER